VDVTQPITPNPFRITLQLAACLNRGILYCFQFTEMKLAKALSLYQSTANFSVILREFSSEVIGSRYREIQLRIDQRGGARHIMITTVSRFLVLVLATTVLTACGGSRGELRPEDRPPVQSASETAEYRLGAGDVVAVNVWKNPDLSVKVPVRPDGYISVPLVGDVLAGGRTPAEISGI